MKTPQLVILAGGTSSRMWPLREKLLLRFGEHPLLFSQLLRYRTLGFEEVVIVASANNVDAIRQIVQSLPDEGAFRVQVTIQQEAKGMGDALLCAEPYLTDPNGALYVNQVHDVVEDALHEGILRMFTSNPQTTWIAGVEMVRYFPGGYLIVDESGLISGIIEKPPQGKEPSRFVNIVAHCHANAARLFDALRAEYARDLSTDDHYERAMDTLMKHTPYRLVPYNGRWDAIKYPWHVLGVMSHFLSRIQGQTIAPDAFIHPTASVVGPVIIESGAKLFAGASVVGPAYIGKKTIVGNGALVRESMVLDGCNVGYTTEVARSYVADGCQMHACRVLDSVFAPNVNFSAGCTTANLRIDHSDVPSTVKGNKIASGRDKLGAIIGENAFLGVDVMTMPGVKIGAGAQVGPGTHVHKDIPDRTKVYVKQELIMKPIEE